MNQGIPSQRLNLGGIGKIIVGILIVLLVLFLLRFAGQFFYFFEEVNPQEVGVQLKGGQVVDIVGPGIYNDVGLFVALERVSSQAVPFIVTDQELITQDKQRLGLVVTADAFRPGVENKDRLLNLWAQYRTMYLEDDLLRSRMEDRAKQAMKVCVGDRTFDESVIGTARDELRQCITSELDEMADAYGVNIANVAVPEVILLPEAQARLDEIVQSRLLTERAVQDRLRAQAEAAAEQARQEGEVRVAQSRIQEESRQQTSLAQLEEAKIASQRAVIEAERANELARVEAELAIIEAEKNNELVQAELDLQVQQARALAAVEAARAELARQVELAALYAESPAYVQLLLAQANASALTETDKIIFTPEGTTPTIVIPGPGIVPTIDTTVTTTAGN